MRSTILLIAALAAKSSGQMMNLTAALTSNPSLSNLTSYVSMFPSLLSGLSNATNVTILAPSNEAFAAFLTGPMATTLTSGDATNAQALLMYHVLKGTYPASAIKAMPAFVPTMLESTGYTNVTGGQRVEAVTQGQSVEFYSGLLQNSTVTTPVSNRSISALKEF